MRKLIRSVLSFVLLSMIVLACVVSFPGAALATPVSNPSTVFAAFPVWAFAFPDLGSLLSVHTIVALLASLALSLHLREKLAALWHPKRVDVNTGSIPLDALIETLGNAAEDLAGSILQGDLLDKVLKAVAGNSTASIFEIMGKDRMIELAETALDHVGHEVKAEIELRLGKDKAASKAATMVAEALHDLAVSRLDMQNHVVEGVHN